MTVVQEVVSTRTRIEAFAYKGKEFPVASISNSIEFLGTGKQACELAPKSVPLSYQAAMFETALLSRLEITTGVPAEVERTAIAHYNTIASEQNKGRGNWCNTAVDYDRDAGRSSPWLPKEYERITIIQRPKLRLRNGIWIPETGKNSERIETDAPPPGFAALTRDGLYQSSGLPYETVNDKRESIRRLKELAMQHGMDEKPAEEFGKKNASYFHRRGRGTGYSPVFRHFYLDDSGPFCVNASWHFERGNGNLGAFLFRSSVKK